MSTPRRPDDIVVAWIEEGPTRLPSETRRAIVVGLPTVMQRRRPSRVPWRFLPVSAPLRLAAGIAAVAIVAVAGLSMLRPAVGPGGAPSTVPPATPEASPTDPAAPTAPSVSLDPRTWTPYTSAQYGFTIRYPTDWNVAPASRPWTFETDATEFNTPAADRFIGPSILVSAWRVPFDAGVSEDTIDLVSWVEDYCLRTFAESCTGIRDRAEPLCNEVRDCHAALLVSYPTETQAFFAFGSHAHDAMTIVTVWRPEDDASTASYGGSRNLLLAFLSTMDVWPAP